MTHQPAQEPWPAALAPRSGRSRLFIMNDNTVAPIGAQIRKLRTDLGLTLEETARRAGTSTPSLHRYETGWDRFRLNTLRRIAGALGADVEVRLVTRQEDGPPRPSPERLVRLLEPLFWDKDLEASDFERYPGWVLERVLVFGNRNRVEAARSFFGDEALAASLERPGVDARTRDFWRLVLEDECIPAS